MKTSAGFVPALVRTLWLSLPKPGTFPVALFEIEKLEWSSLRS